MKVAEDVECTPADLRVWLPVFETPTRSGITSVFDSTSIPVDEGGFVLSGAQYSPQGGLGRQVPAGVLGTSGAISTRPFLEAATIPCSPWVSIGHDYYFWSRMTPNHAAGPTTPLTRSRATHEEHGDAEVGLPRAVEATTWGWVVLEIRKDGTWGNARIIPGEQGDPGDRGDQDDAHALPEMPGARVAWLHVSTGDLEQACSELRDNDGVLADREDSLGPLSHAQALLGDLRQADRHAELVLGASSGATLARQHAQLANAWVALEQANFAMARHHLGIVKRARGQHQDTWLEASYRVANAKLLIASGQLPAALRLLASVPQSFSGTWGWLGDLLVTLRAEALLASGEPQRALDEVTPAPGVAVAEASLLAAAALRRIGDVREAEVTLTSAVESLERAPMGTQVEAWVLESRLAHDRGRPAQARFLVDRALGVASQTELRRCLMRDGAWLRRFVDRDAVLRATYREFLSTIPVDGVGLLARRNIVAESGNVLGGSLTEREAEVLDLLAQMYSTEEIALALFVSSNTVKTHLKGIYSKLGVTRRAAAVRRGRQLDLC